MVAGAWLHGRMSLFGWALVFVGLGLLGLGALSLLTVRLWRLLKALGRESAAAGSALSQIGDDARPVGGA